MIDAPPSTIELPIALSAAFVKPGRVGGAEFMARNLVAGMEAAGRPIHLLAPDGWYLPAANSSVTVQPCSARPSRFLTEARFAFAPPQQFAGTLFMNYFTPPWISDRLGRTATIIVDLMYKHYPQFVHARKRAWLYLAHQLTMRRADRVVVISEFVKHDLLQHYGSRWESKVDAIPVPISWSRFNAPIAPQAAMEPERRVVLSVAAQWPHKNIANLIRAFQRLKERPAYRDVVLVLVGQRHAELLGKSNATSAEEIDRLESNQDVVFTGHISDGELAWYYARCTMFVLPSLFEGFGMPAVEALGLRIPTVVTRLTALPEVTMQLASFIENPLDPESIATSLAEILDAPDAYRPTEEQAARLRERYAPQRIARRYGELFVH